MRRSCGREDDRFFTTAARCWNLPDRGLAGRPYDRETLAELPPTVDPCGENGEFHSFVFDGPNIVSRVGCRVGERVLRDNRFCYCELLPEEA